LFSLKYRQSVQLPMRSSGSDQTHAAAPPFFALLAVSPLLRVKEIDQLQGEDDNLSLSRRIQYSPKSASICDLGGPNS
jgi:hypothetical protein